MQRTRSATWLLLSLLALVATAATLLRYPDASRVRAQDPRLEHVQSGPPPVVEPTGMLEEAFALARTATVRIEARCVGVTWGPPLGVGSGFFVSSQGMLLTAYHVVDPTSTNAPCPVAYFAIAHDESRYPLELVGFDAYMDVAALQAAVDRAVDFLPLVQRAPSVGDAIVAIGNSRNQFLAARAGRVTRLGVRPGRSDFADETIELTASLAPGDSGGPVVNERAEVVGVVSYISFNPTAMSSDSYIPPYLRGVALPRNYASYAVPVTLGGSLATAVMGGSQRDLPVLGFTWPPGADYDPSTSDVYLGSRPGPIVGTVTAGGPADLAGLRSYRQSQEVGPDGSVRVVPVADVIVAVDGVATPTFYDLLAQIRSKAIGQSVELTVQRGNASVRLEIVLGARRAVFRS